MPKECDVVQGALADLKILECAQFISGPYCAKLMADLGAEVIKIEAPGLGDRARGYGPFPQDIPHPEKSGLFIYLNSNKKGITLDLRTTRGMTIFKELVSGADILVENNPPQVMKRLGLNYETLKEVNPRLIMTSLTPFGQTGPYRDYKATELITFHMSGMGHGTPGVVDDPEKEPPLKGGGHQAGFLTGLTAALLTMCAVFARQGSGLGQHIDLSEQEATASLVRGAVAWLSYGNLNYSRASKERPALQRPFMGIMPCKNGYISLVAIEDFHWNNLMNVLGNPDWAEDEICRSRLTRAEHSDILEPRLLEWTMQRTKEEIAPLLQAAHIPCFPVNTIQEAVNSPHLAERGFFVDIDHPEAGKIKAPGAPVKFAQTPWRLRFPAPTLGQHNEEILGHRREYAKTDLVKMKSAVAMQKLPLEGIRVIDFSWAIVGPHATQWMAVMGAEVIRIESSLRSGLFRRVDIGADGKPGLNREAPFNTYNYAKKSCTLNMARPKALEIAKELIKISDVVVDNYAYGVMERMGLGYANLKQLKSDLVVLSSSIPGRSGPDREYFGWGPAGVAFTGLNHMTGYPQGKPERMGGAYPDPLGALYGFFAILAALHHRSKSGEGQFIDLSVYEVVLAQLPEAVLDYAMNGKVRGRVANRDDFMAPHGVYRCRGEDKWVAIAVSSDEEWQALCHAMGDPPWSREERFSSALSRWQYQDELDRLIEGWTTEHSHYEVMEMLQRAGVAAGPSLSPQELMSDPHLKERGFFLEMDHPEVGRRLMVGLPARLSSNPFLNYEHSPLLGEHNQYVFGELLGLSPGELSRLEEEGVIC